MAKVQVVSGFLGAGKTTWIRKMINEVFKNKKVVLIENEFGDIGIDSSFLSDAKIEIKEMNSGCICCSLVGDFEESLKLVIDQYNPDHIIIEPSGVGKLSDVLKAITKVAESTDISLAGALTVVDAKKCKMYMKNFGEFFNDQIEYASAVLLSHKEAVDSEQLSEVVALIKELQPNAHIVTTEWDLLEANEIIALVTGGNSLIENTVKELKEHHHHHEEGEECCKHEHIDTCECEHHHEDGEECCCKHEHHDDCECAHHHEEGEECCKHEHHDDCECEHHHEDDEECCCKHEHIDTCECEHHQHDHHHAEDIFDSWGKETPRQYVKEELTIVLNDLAHSSLFGTVLRAKGIVETNEGWIQFDIVPEEVEIRECKPSFTGQLCVIGVELDKEKLELSF